MTVGQVEPIYSPEQLRVFAAGIPHPEGLAFDGQGWLYAGTAQPGYNDAGPIVRIAPDGSQASRFADTGGRVLGLAFNEAGDLFACDGLQGAVFKVTPAGQVTLFADRVAGRRLLKPNFLVFDRHGTLYVSDSGTARAGEPTGAVFRFTAEGAGSVFVEGLVFANGLALEANGRTLYVVETRDNRVLRVPIHPDGSAGAPAVHVDELHSGPDGLALDAQGNLYITVIRPSTIVRVSPTGQRAILVSDPDDRLLHAPSNLAFGGPGGRQAYIANLFGEHIAMLSLE